MTKLMPRPFMHGSKLAMCMGDVVKGRAGIRKELLPGERRLGGWILPPFQRPLVWTRDQQVRLIESIWLELPIGALVWNALWRDNESPCDGWLLDGQQRLTAIIAYMANEFPVFGVHFGDLDERDHRRWGFSTPISVIETSVECPDRCRDIYERLAYGGTPHKEPQP